MAELTSENCLRRNYGLIYVLEQKSEKVYPYNPQNYYTKMGFKRFTVHGHVSMMFFGCKKKIFFSSKLVNNFDSYITLVLVHDKVSVNSK